MEIKIKETYFETSDYVRGNNVYSAQSLYKFAKEKGYPVRELPLWCINLSNTPFKCNSLYQLLDDYTRIEKCSLEYPIILDDMGQVADGNHRICKAILEGKETIKAIRLEEMPEPSYILKK